MRSRRHHSSVSTDRAIRRLAAALEPAPGGTAARGSLAVISGLGLGAVILTAAEAHLDGALGTVVRALVATALGGGLGITLWRLRTRIAVMHAVRRGLDALGEGFLLAEPGSLRVLHANAGAAAIFARSLDELIGSEVRDLVLAADRPTIDERRRLRAAGHRVPERAPMQVAHAGPDPRFAEWATIPLGVEGRELLLSITRDVTRRELDKRRLADEHAFLEAVLDAAAGPIAVLAPDGRLLRVNAAAARLAGMAPAAMAGRTPWELGLMTADQAAEVAAALRDGRDPYRHCTTTRGPDGRDRVVTWSATAMRDEGRIGSIVSVGADLTDQRAAEGRARRAHAALDLRSHELERSNRDRAQFAELAATDLRQAVRAFRDCAERLEQHVDEHGRGHLSGARAAASGIDELLDGVAAYARLGTGEALASDVDCERTLDAVLTELAHEIEARGAIVTRDPLPVVPGDPEELGSLLSQLVANALRGGGEAVHVGAERRGLGWQLTVSDDGAAVPEDERQRIFERFRGPSGGAVGLAVCRRIVERHGGAIWVDEADGGGSAFHVTLPDREAR